jgi:carbamoyl-phosphate synthase small subunit
MKEIKLVLENGISFTGQSIGYEISSLGILGEVVFNTSMTGYQEIFSDPSYCDQIIVMTYPLIGNYGINQDDYENLTPALKGIVVKEACDLSSNWRNEKSLQDFLKQHKIPGISGVDTRKLTKVIRENGSMKGIFVQVDASAQDIQQMLSTSLEKNQIEKVSCKTASHFPGKSKQRVVMLDFGYKKNILTSLLNRDCDVIVVPFDTKVSEIEKYNPAGIMLSNGPGDPKDIPEVLPEIIKLQEKYPLFAICMGHQLFALANGADTQKMKFGHRGANHPVKDFIKDRVYITSQNHGYAVSESSITNSELEVTQVNLNDKSIEGLKHKTLNAFSVQYHPEANPGPSDTQYLFDEFIKNMKEVQNAR